jgi:hypothetical protein
LPLVVPRSNITISMLLPSMAPPHSRSEIQNRRRRSPLWVSPFIDSPLAACSRSSRQRGPHSRIDHAIIMGNRPTFSSTILHHHIFLCMHACRVSLSLLLIGHLLILLFFCLMFVAHDLFLLVLDFVCLCMDFWICSFYIFSFTHMDWERTGRHSSRHIRELGRGDYFFACMQIPRILPR